MKTSVIIPNYNYAAFLPAAIDSVLAQTERVDEIIVVDDGSTDNSKDVLISYGDKIITIFQDNSGQASAINAGFKKSTGDIIFFLDADDLFAENKVEVIKNLYRENPNISWIFHILRFINTRITEPTHLLDTRYGTDHKIVIDECQTILNGTIRYNKAPATSGLSFRRSFIKNLFPLPIVESVSISDHYIKFYCLSMAAGLHLNTELGQQVIHDNNIYTGQKSNDPVKAKIFINTAIYLLRINPKLRKLCHSTFEEGIIRSRKSGIYDDIKPLIQQYLHDMTRYERARLTLRLVIKKILRRY